MKNANLLLRQYFPRGTDLSVYSQAQLESSCAAPEPTLGKNFRFSDPCQ
jgi:hypothetical protein